MSLRKQVEDMSIKPGNLPQFFIHCLPKESRYDWLAGHPCIERNTLPGPIRSTFEYAFLAADKRRVNLMARNGYTITGVDGKAHAMPGMAAGINKTSTLMQIVSQDALAEDLRTSPLNACIPLSTGGLKHALFFSRCCFISTRPEGV